MKRFLGTMALAVGIAISLPTILDADYIPPSPTPQPIVEPFQVKQAVVYAKKEKPIKQDFLMYKKMIVEAFPNEPVMVAIADAESDFNPKNKNPSSSASGLFQITKGTWADHKCAGDVFNAEDNIACAKKLKASRGTQPWNASKYAWGKVAISTK